jgi:glycine cleavage system H lipoate-binding protein
MSVLIILIFVAIAIGISVYRNRKAVPGTQSVKIRLSNALKGLFVHPGHAWVEVFEPSLVAVGVDDFTKSVFGTVEQLTPPQVGSMLQQGGKAWGLKRGTRQLVQTAPITGRVVEVNQSLVNNPRLLNEAGTEKGWILKVQPISLPRQLKNLITGGTLVRWNQALKEQLAAILGPAGFPVLQDGGELAPNLGNNLTDEQWKKISEEFFKSGSTR